MHEINKNILIRVGKYLIFFKQNKYTEWILILDLRIWLFNMNLFESKIYIKLMQIDDFPSFPMRVECTPVSTPE